jgi:uncharacterized damage-inducible protein DinB
VPEPTTALPSSKSSGEDERSVLLGYLTYHRIVLARKAEGLTDEQAAMPACSPSTMTILGLIRHMTDVERWWFRRVVQGEEVAPLFDDDAEWSIEVGTSIGDALAAYWGEIAVVDRYLQDATMDSVNRGYVDVTGEHALRRTIVHMIEEYARHCGHADLLRERLDGVTGD